MNKLNITDTNEEIDELLEEQKILRDAENIISDTTKKVQRKKTLLIFVISIVIILILALILSTIFALININNTKILNGVFIQGIDVSNLSENEAKNRVSEAIDKHISTEITLRYQDFETKISAKQFNVNFDIEEAVNTAYYLDKSDNIFANNFAILNVLLSNANILPSISYDDELFSALLNEINEQLPGRVMNPDYYINNDNNLIITQGKDGITIDTNELKHNILLLLNNSNTKNYIIDIPVIDTTAEKIDIDKIYEDIYKEPSDAYYTIDPYVVYPSSNGIDFDISIDEAKSITSNYQEEYTIPLKTLYPSVTTNQIGQEAFPDLLAEFSTSFTTSNYNRSTNIELSASKINGLVLMPGETFSYNQVVGQRTKEAGFKPATAYLNGKVVQEYGGGICQVSSTLYNAVLYANLQIVERTNHGYKPTYVKPGLDATVSWGGPDFKFSNNRNYPIKIVCDSSNKRLKIYIYGLKTENDYRVELDAQYISTVYAKTIYENDETLAPGETKVLENGSNGCKTVSYKNLYDANGNLVSSECISRDTYNAHNQIIAVGP